jgi:UDP-N-acetylmuramoylalanine-D-glutamate ligase
MTIKSLSGKSVCILGFGREGKATFDAIMHFAPDAEVIIADANPTVRPKSGTKFIT